MGKKDAEPHGADPTLVFAAFIANNPHCTVSSEKGQFVIGKPWGSEDLRFRCSPANTEVIKDLNNLVFNPRFDAIYHKDTNEIEFIFGFLLPKDELTVPYIDRTFTVNFGGASYECGYREPTKRLFRLAKCFERLPSDSPIRSVPQLTAFRDIQNLDKLPKAAEEFFSARVPRSFFIAPKVDINQVNVEALARHINLLATYYDRRSPIIVIRDADLGAKAPLHHPLRATESDFPKALAITQLDDIIVRLLEVAASSPPRFAFLYFYQVFEYAGYYYVDDKVRRALRNFLKDPAIVSCDDEQVTELFTIFADAAHSDDVKMRRVIEDYCDSKIVWREIQHDKDFFASEQSFDGGFVCPALIAADTTSATWQAMWMPKTFDQLTKIRNALVHARERRENRVILPTSTNDRRILRYVPVIRRIAEQIALKAS